MFNTYISHPTKVEQVTKTVIEKRAPTDDSIHIYEEIKEKAYNSILGTLEVNNNILNVKAIYYQDMYSFSCFCEYICFLNGNEIKGKIKINNSLVLNKDKYAIYEEIVKEVSSNIAIDILQLIGKEI